MFPSPRLKAENGPLRTKAHRDRPGHRVRVREGGGGLELEPGYLDPAAGDVAHERMIRESGSPMTALEEQLRR